MNMVEFGSLFRFIRNGMNIKQDKSGEGLPITRIETIADARVDSSRVGYAGLKESDCPEWMMEPGDILFSHINSVEHIGKCAVYYGTPEKLVHGMNLLCLRCDTKKLLPEFAKYLIRSPAFRARLSNFINKAVNQASVSIGNLKTIPVSVPSLEEQKKIADILDRAEALRAKRRAAIAHLDELTESIFIDIFGDPLKNSKGWDVKPFGTEIKSIRYGTSSPPNYVEEGVPFIRATNVKEGTVNSKDLKRISAEDAMRLSKCKLNSGDLIVVRSGVNAGDCARIPPEYHGACAAFDMIVELSSMNSVFYNFLINSSYGKQHLAPLTRRAAQPHLNADQLRTLLLLRERRGSRIPHPLQAVRQLLLVMKSSIGRLELFSEICFQFFITQMLK